MTTNHDIKDLDILPPKQGRKGDGGAYLVVADDSDEFKVALRYACDAAKTRRAHVGILRILDDGEFQHWGAVEDKIKKELRLQAETYVWSVASMANAHHGTMPSFYFAEGEAGEALIRTIENDHYIVQLVLGGSSGGHPGPLVSFCMGKGLDQLKVPVVVVPGHLKDTA